MLTHNLTRRITERLTRKLTVSKAGGAAASDLDAEVIALFGGGKQGYLYKPDDNSTGWQDTGGAVPITGTGQLVARRDDISGNGNHRTQSTSTKRPQTGAGGVDVYDGVDDGMGSTVPLSDVETWTHIVRIDRGSDISFVLARGADTGCFFGVAIDGDTSSSTNFAAATSIEVDGVSTADNRNALSDSLAGGMRTMTSKLTFSEVHRWQEQHVCDYPGYASAISIGREILINRDLTGDDLATAIAWVEA